MNNIIKIDGHTAIVSFDPDIEMFRGEFVGLNGGADFYAYSMQELKKKGLIRLISFSKRATKRTFIIINQKNET